MADTVYDGNQLSVVFGMTPLTGFAKDTSLRIERENPQYKYNTDLHGNVSRSRVNDNSAKITITLMKASSSNELLSSYVELDRQSDSGTFPILIKDASSTDLFMSASASIMQVPSNEYGEEEKTKEWVIMATNNISYIGN
jgi:hypothetical protein